MMSVSFRFDEIMTKGEAPWKASQGPLTFEGPMTRARKLKFKRALTSLIEHVLNQSGLEEVNDINLKMVSLLEVQMHTSLE